MTCEQSFFLKVLSDHITKKKTDMITDVDWGLLVDWAMAHNVQGILYYQCREFLPSNILDRLDKHFNGAIYCYKNRERILQSIDESFKNQRIPYLTIKGMKVAQYYPIPYLRTMGDSDILVHKEDKERAGSALEELGFHIKEINPDYDWLCEKRGMIFELHHYLLYEEVVTIEKQAQFFNNYWNYENNGELDLNFHFLYLIAHLRKHVMYSGAGFRMFMDLAVVANYSSTLNWKWIEDKLIDLDMLRFAQVCFALIDQWFGISIPIDAPEVSTSFLEEATAKVFANGIFGYDNEDNKNNITVNKLISSGTVNGITRLRVFRKSLFPNYNNMANSPYYHFVRGKAWLLPVAWIYRFFRLIMGKTLSIKDIMKGVMLSEEIIDERVIELKEWGLL